MEINWNRFDIYCFLKFTMLEWLLISNIIEEHTILLIIIIINNFIIINQPLNYLNCFNYAGYHKYFELHTTCLNIINL